MTNRYRNTAVGAVALVSPLLSYAVVDVTAVVTEIGTAAAPIAAIGAAMLIAKFGPRLWKLIARAF